MPVDFPIPNHFLTGHQHEGISSVRGLDFVLFIFHLSFYFYFLILHFYFTFSNNNSQTSIFNITASPFPWLAS